MQKLHKLGSGEESAPSETIEIARTQVFHHAYNMRLKGKPQDALKLE